MLWAGDAVGCLEEPEGEGGGPDADPSPSPITYPHHPPAHRKCHGVKC